ncbi:MAG: hypothetical protein ABI286_12180 [Edaphobacter sp.]
MLDVHPPHEAAHTWKDFFIHIITIVIGLLIAIGLEQTVEAIHHRREVQETREAIQHEREVNRRHFAGATAVFRVETRQLQTNLAVFRYLAAHPHASPSQLPGTVNWHSHLPTFSFSAWETAQHDNVTALMPQREVREDEELYAQLHVVRQSYSDRLAASSRARIYMAADADPTHLSSEQAKEQIKLAEAVLIAEYRLGSDMRNLHANYIDFTPWPTNEELIRIVHEDSYETDYMKEMKRIIAPYSDPLEVP